MIRKGKDLSLQMRAVAAAMMIDCMQHGAYLPRMAPLGFESFADEYAFSQVLWQHVNRETKCDLCGKSFEYEGEQMHFSLAVGDKRVHFLHKDCTSTVNPLAMVVVMSGYRYPDTMHWLSVIWRGNPDRAVIGDSKGCNGLLNLLDAQERAQDMAEVRALQAELERRRTLRAAAVIQ